MITDHLPRPLLWVGFRTVPHVISWRCTSLSIAIIHGNQVIPIPGNCGTSHPLPSALSTVSVSYSLRLRLLACSRSVPFLKDVVIAICTYPACPHPSRSLSRTSSMPVPVPTIVILLLVERGLFTPCPSVYTQNPILQLR